MNGKLINGIFKICDVKLNYATTVHKYQGKTIYEPFNIFINKRMSFEVLYTALSRATKIEDIHLDNNEIKRTFKSEYDGIVFRELIKKVVIGYIYLIKCDITGKWYIGMTLGCIYKRLNEHLLDIDSVVKLEMENPCVKLIGTVKGTEKMIRKFERNYTIEYKRLYGDDCINRTNFKEDKIEVGGWNYIETITTKITEGDGYFMVQYHNLDKKWMSKKICFKKIGRDEGLNRINNFIKSLK